jgi:hypothetical protein
VSAIVGIAGWTGVTWSDFKDALWPAVVVAGLALIVVLLVGDRIYHHLRTPRVAPPSERDQQRLDEILSILQRPKVNFIESHDFHGSWPSAVMDPIHVYLIEANELEDRFADEELEAKRKTLAASARSFEDAEGHNGFPTRHQRGWRDAGWTEGEVEGMPERQALVYPRWDAIFEARNVFLDAFNDFLTTADERGYDLGALSGETHPKMVEWTETLRGNTNV